MTKLTTLGRLPRTAGGAAIALLLAVVVAAPAAAATPPTRTVHFSSGWYAPAGQACTFDIRGVPTSGFIAVTTFSDGTQKRSVRIKGYYENVATGARFYVNDSWSETDVYDPETNTLLITANGHVDVPFWVGDASPFGGVVTTPAYYEFDGTTTNLIDFNANRTAAFSWSGRVIDICAALS
jgi:hypothetical protein